MLVERESCTIPEWASLVVGIDRREILDDAFRAGPDIMMVRADAPAVPVLGAPVLVRAVAVEVEPPFVYNTTPCMSRINM